MPPSAGACHTIDASLKPDCGRAGPRSSIITAIGWSAAAAGLTNLPVSGSETRAGAGTGVGEGTGVGDGGVVGEAVGVADGPTEAWAWVGLGITPVAGGALGVGVAGEQAASRNRQATANRT